MNPKKCVFGLSSGKWLGFIVSKRGIEIDPVKVRVFIQINTSKNWEASSDGCNSYGGSYLNIPTGVNLSTNSWKEGQNMSGMMNAKLHLTEWSTCSIHLYWSHQVDHFYSISPQQTTLSEWFCFGPVRRYRKKIEGNRLYQQVTGRIWKKIQLTWIRLV